MRQLEKQARLQSSNGSTSQNNQPDYQNYPPNYQNYKPENQNYLRKPVYTTDIDYDQPLDYVRQPVYDTYDQPVDYLSQRKPTEYNQSPRKLTENQSPRRLADLISHSPRKGSVNDLPKRQGFLMPLPERSGSPASSGQHSRQTSADLVETFQQYNISEHDIGIPIDEIDERRVQEAKDAVSILFY